MAKQVRVFIVDKNQGARSKLAALLARKDDIRVVGKAASGEDAISSFRKCRPTVAVVDYELPVMSGAELCERMVALRPNFPVVIFTRRNGDDAIRSAIDAGARSFVYKNSDGAELVKAIRVSAKGGSFLDPKMAGRVMEWANRTTKSGSAILSKNETRVLRLVAKGASNEEVAEELGLSTNTVKTYMRRIFEKLECSSRKQASMIARKRGII